MWELKGMDQRALHVWINSPTLRIDSQLVGRFFPGPWKIRGWTPIVSISIEENPLEEKLVNNDALVHTHQELFGELFHCHLGTITTSFNMRVKIYI